MTPQPIPRHVAFMRVVVSLVVLAVCFGILTAPNVMFGQPFDDGVQKFSCGWIGMVIGYWLS